MSLVSATSNPLWKIIGHTSTYERLSNPRLYNHFGKENNSSLFYLGSVLPLLEPKISLLKFNSVEWPSNSEWNMTTAHQKPKNKRYNSVPLRFISGEEVHMDVDTEWTDQFPFLMPMTTTSSFYSSRKRIAYTKCIPFSSGIGFKSQWDLSLTLTKIKNISQFHSCEKLQKGLRMWIVS